MPSEYSPRAESLLDSEFDFLSSPEHTHPSPDSNDMDTDDREDSKKRSKLPKLPPDSFRKITHNDRIKWECTIDGCGRTFTRKGLNAKSHFFTHTGYQPYSCSQCPAKFTRNYDRKRHEDTHVKRNRRQKSSASI
ncbi:hypothetical protein EDD86DRAFT_202191 [Gorgonomyces haynaldii]|nr:hypothetical protein EDD86DRAFT_202191 [Gorgonomyces haynaldii]